MLRSKPDESIDDRIAKLAASCATDPLGWIDVAYDWGKGDLANHNGPRDWQFEEFAHITAHLSNPKTRFTPYQAAIASGHGIGKSAWFGMLINWALSTCPNTKVVVTANTEAQLLTKTSPEISKWHRLALNAHWFDLSAQSIAVKDVGASKEWRANFVTWSKNNTEAFAGLHNEGRRIVIVFDEASAIDDAVWEVAQGALTDENTEILWIAFGNPTRNVGMFRECFGKFAHRWRHRKIDSRTVEGTNKTKFAEWAADWGEDSDFFKVRVRGEFPSASANALFSVEDVDNAMQRVYPPETQSHAAIILGVDVARQGDDMSATCRRQGMASFPIKLMRIPDTMLVAQSVSIEMSEHNADACFVDETGGYGAGVVDALRQIGKDPIGVQFAGKANDMRYFNKRSEMYFELHNWIKSGGSIPYDSELKEELCATEYSFQGDKFRLVSKDDIKELIGRSPDRADALALTFAYPVSPKTVFSSRPRVDAQRGHDPFAIRR